MADNKSEEYSYIGDKGEVGFIDFADDKSVTSYNPTEEGPVIVSVPFPFVQGKPQSVHVNEVAIASFTIENTTKETVDLWGVNIHASNPEDSFLLSLMKPPSGQPDDIPKEEFVGSFSLEDRALRPRDILTVWLSCEPKEIGVYTSIVHIDIGDERIERVVFLLVEDKVSKALASEKPYRRGRKKNAFTMNSSYVTGVRPSNPSKHSYKNRLPVYDIPKEIREMIENTGIPEVVKQGLTRNNYAAYFKALLIMEELRIEEDMKAYDMEYVSMRQRGHYCLTLEVPGLAERRPSLVHGDAVFVRLVNDNNDKAYEGCIHRVEADEVSLQFADVFHRRHTDENLYNVRFKYNRVNFRRLYQAIEAAEALHKKFLFPSQYDGMRSITGKALKPISSLNEEQANAVRLILGCRGGAPYLIHGPPGTGKTKTLVEAILQLYTTRGSSRILVCASSNCAADHLLEKILCEAIEIKENEILRLNATSRPFEDINPDFLRFCFFEEEIFKCPSPEMLCSYRIIITTYMSASLLYAEGVKRGHFSHIILDEAGQASEPETMIPISNHCHNNTVIVLAGDPMQLGPVINSKNAEAHGLGRSYLERLFHTELYNTEDQNYVTMLVKNYRCHPEILSLPSRLFYQSMLIASREEGDVSSLPWTDLLPNREFPVLFIGIQGLDEREGSNPSWFNRIEASKVVELIKKLTSRKVKEQDIGVITPYRQQVMKIKKALEGLDKPDIKIGSVEQFQGQEREVIIVSTVRSTVKHNEFDKTFCLGFLSNPKRFNVAMTRARSLLIIVGNPHIIAKDCHWEQMLWHCADNNSYQGCTLPVKEQPHPDDDGPVMDNGDNPTGKTGNSGPDGDWNVDNWDPLAANCGPEGEWNEDNYDPPTDNCGLEGAGWNGVNEDASYSKAIKDEDEWSDGWK